MTNLPPNDFTDLTRRRPVELPPMPGDGPRSDRVVATVGRRISGFLIDAALGVAAAIPCALATGLLIGAVMADGGGTRSAITPMVLNVVGLVLLVALGIGQWASSARTGATLGRRAAGYRLVDEASGTPPGWGRAFGHYALTWGLVNFTFGLGALVVAIVAAQNPERRTFIDRATRLRTEVVQRRQHAIVALLAVAFASTGTVASYVVPVLVASSSVGSDSGYTSDDYYASDDGTISTDGSVDDPTGSSTADTTDADDPLGIGIPFVNQACSGEYVVLLRSSGDPDTYAEELELAAAEAADAQYLRTDESCSGFYQDIDGNAIYGGYIGPYPSLDAACAERSSRGLDESSVIRLDPDRDESRAEC